MPPANLIDGRAIAGKITPNPGVGPMTIALRMPNTARAAEIATGKPA